MTDGERREEKIRRARIKRVNGEGKEEKKRKGRRKMQLER